MTQDDQLHSPLPPLRWALSLGVLAWVLIVVAVVWVLGVVG